MQRHSPHPAQPDALSSKIGYVRRILDSIFGSHGNIWGLEQRFGKTEVEKSNKQAQPIDYYIKTPKNKSKND